MPLIPSPLLAHADPVAAGLSVVVGVGLAALYAYGSGLRGGPPSAPAGAAAVAALAVWLVAVNPAFARLGEERFAWHMVQHLLFTMVVPPLIVLARPGPPVASALAKVRHRFAPRSARTGSTAIRRRHPSRRGGAATVAAALVATAVLWLWHVPALYDAAVDLPMVHGLEHATLIVSATVAWWLIASRASARAAGLVALVVMAVGGSTLGALLTFAPGPLYRSHEALGDALADQQLAGLLMWVPGGVVPLLGAVILTTTALTEAARRVRLREVALHVASSRPMAVVVVALAMGVAACADRPTGSGGVDGGDASRAPAAFDRYGCGACHSIPGTRHDGRVGPPLTHMGERAYIAGALTNTPEHMVEWLTSPQSVQPGTAMPDLEVTEDDARDMAAYLLQLGD